MSAAAVILAHQGGWDEMLLVAAPIVVFVLLLRLANRRADQQLRAKQAAGTGVESDAPPVEDRGSQAEPDDGPPGGRAGGRPGTPPSPRAQP